MSRPLTTRISSSGLSGGRFARGNLALETALGGIVFEEVSQIVGGDDVADGDDFDIFADHALFLDGAENQPANASKSIDCNFNCHIFNSFYSLSGSHYRS